MPRKRRAQRLAMSDAPKDSNVCILSDHVDMGWHRHRCGGYVCRIMYVLLVKASQVAGGIKHRFQFWAWALIFCYPSSVFCRANANACTLRTVPWRWGRGRPASCAVISGFSTAASIRIEGNMAKKPSDKWVS
jgi:hypothetical protein